MYIYYRDEIGIIRIDGVDNIQFLDGIVYFNSDYDEFQLYVSQIVEIGKE